MQTSINKIEEWASVNGFKFSESKSKCIHFCRKRRLHSRANLTFNGSQIANEREIKLLGMILNCKLFWRSHIKNTIAICKKSLNVIKCVSGSKWGANRKCLLKIHQFLVLSRINYESIVYKSASNTELKKLDVINHSRVRLCIGAFCTSSTVSILVEAGIKPLNFIREATAMKYGLKILSDTNHSNYEIIKT